MNSVGSYLKKCREQSGATQNDVARYLGYDTAQTISSVERGVAKPPLNTARKWCDCIGASKQLLAKMMIEQKIKEIKEALK